LRCLRLRDRVGLYKPRWGSGGKEETDVVDAAVFFDRSPRMNRARIDGKVLEYEVRGAGEPVVLVHGAHIADAFAPLLAEPTLTERYRLIPCTTGAGSPPAPTRRTL
jgi:hypothetical protein